MEYNFSSWETSFRSKYLNYRFICLVTVIYDKDASCPHFRELSGFFLAVFKLEQLEGNSVKSCIFVSKYTPKFKGAREELHVIRTTCTLQCFSSMNMNTPYGHVWISIAHTRVINKLSICLLGRLLIHFFLILQDLIKLGLLANTLSSILLYACA